MFAVRPLFVILAVTGMRRGEALGLRWPDLDLEHGVIRVSQQIVVVGARLEAGPPTPPAGAPSRSPAGSPKRCAATPPHTAWTGSQPVMTGTTADWYSPPPSASRYLQRSCLGSSTGSPHKQACR